MTDEEIAEEYAKSIVIFDRDFHNDRFAEIEQAFLAGLKAGRPKWHDLRKDPNDLPDNYRYVWTNVGTGYHDDELWWNDFGRLQNVVAWCEPKFEEEEND